MRAPSAYTLGAPSGSRDAPIDIVLHQCMSEGSRVGNRWESLIVVAVIVAVLLLLHYGAGRWLRKRREQDEPWLAQTELWDRLDGLLSQAEADGCRLWVEDGKIRFGGDVLTQRASAILTVLENHHDDTLIVLANRRQG